VADFLSPVDGARVLRMGSAGLRRAHARVRNAGEVAEAHEMHALPRRVLRIAPAAQNQALRQKGEELLPSPNPWQMPEFVPRDATVQAGRPLYAQALANARYITRKNEWGGQVGQWQHARGPLVLQTGGVARWRFVRDGKAGVAARQSLRMGGVRALFHLIQYLPEGRYLLRMHGGANGAARLLKDNGWQGARQPVRFSWYGLRPPQDFYDGIYEAERRVLHIGGAGAKPPQALQVQPYSWGRIALYMGGVAPRRETRDTGDMYPGGLRGPGRMPGTIGQVTGVRVVYGDHPNFPRPDLRRPLAIGGADMNHAIKANDYNFNGRAYFLQFGWKQAAREIRQEYFGGRLLQLGNAGPVDNSTASGALQQNAGTRALRFALPAPRKLYHGNYAKLLDPQPSLPPGMPPMRENVAVRRVVRLGLVPNFAELLPRDAPKVRRALRIGSTGHINNETHLEQKEKVRLPPDWQKIGPRPDVAQTGRITYHAILQDIAGIDWKLVSLDTGPAYIPFDFEQQRRVLHMPGAGPVDAPDGAGTQWLSSWFPLLAQLPMPWGQTLVDALVHAQQLAGFASGRWALHNARWSHDNGSLGAGHGKMGAALDGGGAWEVTGSNAADGSAWGTLSGHGTWHESAVSKKEYYDEEQGAVVTSRVYYTGGIWGGFGTWHIDAQGALSWVFTINQGSGWRLEKRDGSAMEPFIQGRGFTPGMPIHETGEGGKETRGPIFGGFEFAPPPYVKPSDNPDDWFDSGVAGDIYAGGAIAGADAVYGKPQTPQDLPPKSPPPDGEDDDGSKGGPPPLPDADPLKKPWITLSGGMQQIGPAGGMALPAPPAKGQMPRAMGSIGTTELLEYVDGGSIRIAGHAAADTNSFAAIKETIHARGRFRIQALVHAQETARALGTASVQAAVHITSAARAFGRAAACSGAAVHMADGARAQGAASAWGEIHMADAARAFGTASPQGEVHMADAARAFGAPAAGSHTQAGVRGTLHARDGVWAISGGAAHAAATIHAAACVWARDAAASAWVLAPESGAAYFWDNWQFGSMVQIGDRIFAAGPQGLALLGADTDAGEPISACVQYGFSELGGFHEDGRARQNSAKKRVPYLYFGYTASGPLQATCETYGQGLPVFRYPMPAAPAQQPVTSRIAIGKGLNARWWRIGIENTAGGNFAVHSIAAEVAPGKRRI